MKIRPRWFLLAWILATHAVDAHAQTQQQPKIPRCTAAQIIVTGAYRSAQFKQQGQSYDQQAMNVQSMAARLAVRFGDNMGQTYAEVEAKLLQNLYTNPAYTQMTPEQFRDAMSASFAADCSQAT
ncbi:hypothetical protein DWU98_09300 [Dyella monticola]|uniref:Uncharacterized protein n=1 Tax=Dyella monticola TaxID=1927958 RepID=A0A370X1D6_9GAMM|nr:hypothetical protein [Dyella monticola]RDS82223.1 hypothetical protein DWU98_09300 [Dyella monticola]